MRVATILALALLTGPVCASDSSTFDGNTLLRQCQRVVDALDGRNVDFASISGNWCVGYVRGVFESLIWTAQYSETQTDPRVCFPKGVSVEQATRVVVKYLHDHPAALHEHGLLLVVGAFADAFPCADSGG